MLERLWLTGEIFSEKPGVENELQNLSYYLKQIFPVVFNSLDDRLRDAWEQVWPDAEPLQDNELPMLKFGSWVGGDRDGHPKVTARVTRDTLTFLVKGAEDVVRGVLPNWGKACLVLRAGCS